ncbi:MAG: ankyrin repeat protein [Candidatus Paraimprobicoccus trichonymphae]|uniref:Ankyrin repeat protein n=1 Tax=Candidatus Paraimprobicoccus trichonymphae TaxID=3033793 RepID=A0AA48IHK8_9FIRM|nr:MAG: ankyrin repeat protein [Candidatus Paraimprobicoccus trichonymphae]
MIYIKFESISEILEVIKQNNELREIFKSSKKIEQMYKFILINFKNYNVTFKDFRKHALKKFNMNNTDLSDEELNKIAGGVNKGIIRSAALAISGIMMFGNARMLNASDFVSKNINTGVSQSVTIQNKEELGKQLLDLMHFRPLDIERAKILIENGANVKYKDSFGSTVLHMCNSITEAKNFIERGAVINEKDSRGNTPLHLSV